VITVMGHRSCPVFSARPRRLGFCAISGPELVWPLAGGVLQATASFSSSAEGATLRRISSERRPAEDSEVPVWQLRTLHAGGGPRPNEAQKKKDAVAAWPQL
jgi:hypothetical protein